MVSGQGLPSANLVQKTIKRPDMKPLKVPLNLTEILKALRYAVPRAPTEMFRLARFMNY